MPRPQPAPFTGPCGLGLAGRPDRPRADQELLHRYTAIDRWDAIGPAFDALLGVVDIVHPIERDDVERARRLVRVTARLSARDAVHIAVMQRREIDRILTFDAGFDGIVGIERVRA